MGALQRFEQRLENVISGVFARVFRSAVQPVEISSALQREVDNNSQILSRNRRLVPNEFRVELSAPDFERLAQYDSAMQRDLVEQLEEHAEAQGYVFPGDVEIAFDRADDLTTGRFRIVSQAKASVSGGHAGGQRPRYSHPTAVLEINGTRHPLVPPGVIIGRGSEADIRINDPGVSRKHVEFEVTHTEHGTTVIATDLGSTNGMTVNGHSMPRASLPDGTVVRIGSTDVIVHIDPDRG